MTRAAIYLRESTIYKDDRYGIPVQRDHAEKHCQTKRYEIVGYYTDPGEESSELWRPELERLRADMADGKFDVIVVDATDRMARGGWLMRFLMAEAKVNYDVKMEFTRPGQQWDLDTPEGLLMASVQMFTDEQERSNIIERTQNARKKRASEGDIIPGPRPPYGYLWTGDKKRGLDLNPDTAPILRRIADETLGGRLPGETMDGLDADRVPLPSGEPGTWHNVNITRILRESYYKGEYVIYKTQYQRVRRVKPDGAPYHPRIRLVRPEDAPDRHVKRIPAIVTLAEWDAIQAIIDDRRIRSARNSSDPEVCLLRAGIAVCGYCGRPMTCHYAKRQDKSREGWYYRCSVRSHPTANPCSQPHTIRAEKLDADAWDAIERFVGSPEKLEALFAEIIASEQERNPAAETDLDHIAKQLADLEKEVERLARRIAREDDDVVAAVYQFQLKRTLGDIKGTKKLQADALNRARYRVDLATQREQRLAFMHSEWARLIQGEDSYTLKRNFLATQDVRVLVWKGGHTPEWAMLFFMDRLIEDGLMGLPPHFKVIRSDGLLDDQAMLQLILDLAPLLEREVAHRRRRSQRKPGFLSAYDRERYAIAYTQPHER